jgi:hypothetical protein
VDNNKNIPNNFDLPDGYFKNSKAGILNKIEWMQEHEAYPTLSSFTKESGFTVPLNYFNESASRLELVDAPILSNIQKQNAFEVPAGYFENNRSLLIAGIDEGKELRAYPTLASIEKKNAFVTSDNYFEASKKIILGKNEGGARIISLFGRSVRYAAAAVLMITIGLWVYNSYFKTQEVETECTTLACFEKRELIKYKLENFDTEEILDGQVDLNTLEKNLNKVGTEKSDSTKTADSTDEALLDYID